MADPIILPERTDRISEKGLPLQRFHAWMELLTNKINDIRPGKSYSFTSQGLLSGTFYKAGFYEAPATDANLDQATPTQTLGTANISYAAHAFLVASGPGSTDAGVVEIEVSGTSIDDEGNRVAADTEVIVADITSMTTDEYFETPKKWLGQITYTLQAASGAPTVFSADFNYGFAKYDDFGNRDFIVTDIEAVGQGNASDSSFDVQLLKHSDEGWTYSAAAFVPGSTAVVSWRGDHAPEADLANDQDVAWKRVGLTVSCSGATGGEGVIVRVITGSPNSIQTMDIHIGIDPVS